MTNESAGSDSFRLIRCYVGNESYGLDMSWVHSIQRTDLVRPANGHDHSSNNGPRSDQPAEGLIGWLDVEGKETPIFNLDSKLGRSSDQTVPSSRRLLDGESQRVVVLHPPYTIDGKDDEIASAFLVDRVSQVIQIPSDRVMPLPPIAIDPQRLYFAGIIWLQEEMVLLLATENLLPEMRQSVDHVGDQTQESIMDGALHGEAKPVAKQVRSKPIAEGRHVSPGQIVVFNLHAGFEGEQALSFGLSVSQVPEILETLPMIQVPGAPAFVSGLLRWRERPVPLIDLADRLKMSVERGITSNGNTHLIVVRDRAPEYRAATFPSGTHMNKDEMNRSMHGVFAAFRIQPGVRILRLPISNQPYYEELPLDKEMLRGVYTTEGEMLVIPDVQSVLRREG